MGDFSMFHLSLRAWYQGSGARTRNGRNWRNSNSNWGSFAFAFCGVIYMIYLNFCKQHWNEQIASSIVADEWTSHLLTQRILHLLFYQIDTYKQNASGLKKCSEAWPGDLPISMTGQPFPWLVSLKNKAGYKNPYIWGWGVRYGEGGRLTSHDTRSWNRTLSSTSSTVSSRSHGWTRSSLYGRNFGDLGHYRSCKNKVKTPISRMK